ncbi:MAG TPA: hypothetical protein VGC27_01080 [Rhizomicrobium sp.]
MIPLWMSFHLRTPRGTSLRLGLPLFLIWLLLLPLAIVIAPFALIACVLLRFSPLGCIAFIWGLLSAARGTHLEIEAPDGAVFLHLY